MHLRDLWKGLLTILAVTTLLHTCSAQPVTLHRKKMPIVDVFREIERQTHYLVDYSPDRFTDANLLDLDFDEADVSQVLKYCLAGLPLDYKIGTRAIIISVKNGGVPLSGRVQNADGQPLEGASITAEGVQGKGGGAEGMQVARSGFGGVFYVPGRPGTVVTISFQGYTPRLVALNNIALQVITMLPSASTLNDVIVQAYGRTTSRLATGTDYPVKAPGLQSQPAGNVLGALEGRVPGLAIQASTGGPGSNYRALIRGRQSISQGTDPLIVIDGVPVATKGGYLSTLGSGSAQGPAGASVLNGIPLTAVASVNVLEGAAATAIYGSRGANGVILITLDTGLAEKKMKWGADVYSGADWVVKVPTMLNTAQYLAMRKEAVVNDGGTVGPATVPEAYAWSSTRYTNFERLVMGNTGVRQNAKVDLSGGDSNTVYLLSGNYYRQTSVFPGSTGDDRISVFGHLHQQSVNKRLKLDFSALYSWEDNRLPIQDYTFFGSLAPNAPSFEDANHQPVWSYNNMSFLNIPAQENNGYKSSVSNQFDHIGVSFDVVPGLLVRANLGYYRIASAEHSQVLIAGQDPATNPTGRTYYAGNTGHNEMAEALAEYTHDRGPGRLEALLGVNWQGQETDYSSLAASGYTSDALLAIGGGTPTFTSSENSTYYRYDAVFGRVNYVLYDRYILTLSGRRDGSSRFGASNPFGNFWGIGAAWIFSEEAPFRHRRWLSYGKLRGSLGTAGNDQIGDTTFAQVYTGTTAARGYQGQQGIYPVTFANPHVGWEVNYNSELALDVGFAKNRVMLSVIAYRDWTTNQLIYTTLASQAGLPGVYRNVAAEVVNEGLQFSLETYNVTHPHFQWTSLITLTAPVNRLARFPGLSSAVDASSLVVGKSLSVAKGYHYEGVDPATGLYKFEPSNGQAGTLAVLPGGNLDERYYGGCDQRLSYKDWRLDVFFEFRAQNGVSPFVALYPVIQPGFQEQSMLGNPSVAWLNRWQKPGDHALLEQVTESAGSAAYAGISNYIASDAKVANASYIRWKGLMLSYRLPKGWLPRTAGAQAVAYLKGENLLTFTHYPVTDPETQNPSALPPVRSLVAGIKVNI